MDMGVIYSCPLDRFVSAMFANMERLPDRLTGGVRILTRRTIAFLEEPMDEDATPKHETP